MCGARIKRRWWLKEKKIGVLISPFICVNVSLLDRRSCDLYRIYSPFVGRLTSTGAEVY